MDAPEVRGGGGGGGGSGHFRPAGLTAGVGRVLGAVADQADPPAGPQRQGHLRSLRPAEQLGRLPGRQAPPEVHQPRRIGESVPGASSAERGLSKAGV